MAVRPASDARQGIAAYDLEVILLCQEGYTSSLAVANLQECGIHRATDVIGGYAAWRDAGLPLDSGWKPPQIPA